MYDNTTAMATLKLNRARAVGLLTLIAITLAILSIVSAHKGHHHNHNHQIPKDSIHANADPSNAGDCPFHKAAAASEKEQTFHALPIYDKDGNLVGSNVEHGDFPGSASSSRMKALFAFLFPGSPMVNSLLGPTYISIIPNLLLYFVPPDIKPESLNTL
ncbi:hypothetical protein BGZ95_004196, partial [Linnemannia exigua]